MTNTDSKVYSVQASLNNAYENSIKKIIKDLTEIRQIICVDIMAEVQEMKKAKDLIQEETSSVSHGFNSFKDKFNNNWDSVVGQLKKLDKMGDEKFKEFAVYFIIAMALA